MIALNGEYAAHKAVQDIDQEPVERSLRPTRRTIWRRKHEIRAGGAPHFYMGAMTPELPPDDEVRVGYRNRVDDPAGEGYEYVGFAYRGHLHFDNLPQGVTVAAAHLILHVDETLWQVGGQPAGKAVSAAKALLVLEAPLQKGDAAFFTPAYTWCELPTEITGITGTGALGKASFSLAEGLKIDVTGIVRAWVAGEAHNHGFVIVGPNEDFAHNNDVQESTYGETLLVIRLQP